MTSLVCRSETGLSRDSRVQIAVVGASTFALPVVLLLVPLTWALYTGAFVAAAAIVAAIPWNSAPPPVGPEAIADPQLRMTFIAIEAARERLDREIESARRFRECGPSVRERCDAAVASCARLVPSANAVHAQLSTTDVWGLAVRGGSLRGRARQATDAETARAFAGAADACDRQLAVCADLMRVRERIVAKFELVLGALRAFAASVAAQQTREDEQIACAASGIADDLGEVTGQLKTLDAALELS